MESLPTYQARCALPYPHAGERAAAGLRGALRLRLAPRETPDWATFSVTGPEETIDAHGRVWYEYTAELTTTAS